MAEIDSELTEIEDAVEGLRQQGWNEEFFLVGLYRKVGRLMAQIDDLMAAVAADQAATDTAVALLGSLNASVTQLQTDVANLEAQIAANQPPDLTAVTASVQALADQLVAAETPPAPPAV